MTCIAMIATSNCKKKKKKEKKKGKLGQCMYHIFVVISDLPFAGSVSQSWSKAIFAQTFQMRCWYRQGYIHDISVPLYPQFQADESLRGVSATSRRFFVTFKGKFYMERGSYIQDCHFCSFKKLNLHRLSLTQCHIHPKDKKKKTAHICKRETAITVTAAHEYHLCTCSWGKPTSELQACWSGVSWMHSCFYCKWRICSLIWTWHWLEFNFYFFWGHDKIWSSSGNGKKNVFQRVNILKTQLVRNSERPTRDSNVHY